MKGKRIRKKGKIRFSGYFKNLEDGTRVGVVREYSVRASFPHRLLGNTGIIKGTRGTHKLVEIKTGNKIKTFIIHPIHLKELK